MVRGPNGRVAAVSPAELFEPESAYSTGIRFRVLCTGTRGISWAFPAARFSPGRSYMYLFSLHSIRVRIQFHATVGVHAAARRHGSGRQAASARSRARPRPSSSRSSAPVAAGRRASQTPLSIFFLLENEWRLNSSTARAAPHRRARRRSGCRRRRWCRAWAAPASVRRGP